MAVPGGPLKQPAAGSEGGKLAGAGTGAAAPSRSRPQVSLRRAVGCMIVARIDLPPRVIRAARGRGVKRVVCMTEFSWYRTIQLQNGIRILGDGPREGSTLETRATTRLNCQIKRARTC